MTLEEARKIATDPRPATAADYNRALLAVLLAVLDRLPDPAQISPQREPAQERRRGSR